MKQYTYTLDDAFGIKQMLDKISAEKSYQKAQASLMLIYEPVCEKTRAQELIDAISAALPDTGIFGMTTLGPLRKGAIVPEHTVCSLLCFEAKGSGFVIRSYDCTQRNYADAGAAFCHELDRIKDLRGVFVAPACASLNPQPFFDVVNTHRNVDLFGNMAGTSSAEKDLSFAFTNDQIIERGIVCAAIFGPELHLMDSHTLGWRPIGKMLTITDIDEDGYIKTINGLSAMKMYKKYLDVDPDEYFYENICAFPLIKIDAKGCEIACVPDGYKKDGALHFSVDLSLGTQVRLSYSRPVYLLKTTCALANSISQFAPEALILFACVNRRSFMDNDNADAEIDYFYQVCPDMAWSYGNGEILESLDAGGYMNSTLVPVAMREGEPDLSRCKKIECAEVPGGEIIEKGAAIYIPLSRRIVNFLEATASELNRANDELMTLANTDQLTGIYNRRHIEKIFEQALESLDARDNLSLLMFDIDWFKRVNDEYGHKVGDHVLCKLADTVRKSIRREDSIGRWGGEEFLVVVPGAKIDEARKLAERICKKVAKTDFEGIGRLTISIGVTGALPTDTVDDMFARVDHALYDAKGAGRNCVATR